GNALARLGKTNEAATAYERALKLSGGNDATALVNFGNSLQDAGKLDEAISHYNQALRANPNLVEAHNALGVAFVRKNQFTDAIAEFETALRINPNSQEARGNLAITVNKQSQAANDAGLALA